MLLCAFISTETDLTLYKDNESHLIFSFLSALHSIDLDFPPSLASSHNCGVAVETGGRAAEMQPDMTEKDLFCFLLMPLIDFYCLLMDETHRKK